MVVVLGLALLSEVAVGLDAVLEAVELAGKLANSCSGGQAPAAAPSYSPPGRAGAVQRASWTVTYLPARVCNLATGLADWTRSQVSINKYTGMSRPRRSGRVRARARRTVEGDNFSHGGWRGVQVEIGAI